VKCRIALAIDHRGDWNCAGWGGMGTSTSDRDKMGTAIGGTADGERRYWIEVEIPIPESTVIDAIAEAEAASTPPEVQS